MNISRHQAQVILYDLDMIDENGLCPYTADEIFVAAIKWYEDQLRKWLHSKHDIVTEQLNKQDDPVYYGQRNAYQQVIDKINK